MSNSKILKENVNTTFFDIPRKSLVNKLYILKYHMNVMKIPADKGELFLCNKTSKFDKHFVNSALEGNFVYLKDKYITQLYDNTLSLKDEKDIFDEVAKLKSLAISIVVFPEKHLTTFGDFEKLPDHVASFLLRFEMNIKFINLIGTYFICPVWSATTRTCDTKLEHKFTFNLSEQKFQEKPDNIDKINKFLPSSASIYAKKFPLYMRSNRCAEYLERILYSCPNCKQFFYLYSEFNCVKCTNCGSAFEISNLNSEISLTSTFTSLDEAKNFQFGELENKNFGDDQIIVSYNNLVFNTSKKAEKETFENVKLDIYKNKIIYTMGNMSTLIPFEMIFEFYLDYENTLHANVLDDETQASFDVSFKGENRENLYILVDLLKIFEQANY